MLWLMWVSKKYFQNYRIDSMCMFENFLLKVIFFAELIKYVSKIQKSFIKTLKWHFKFSGGWSYGSWSFPTNKWRYCYCNVHIWINRHSKRFDKTFLEIFNYTILISKCFFRCCFDSQEFGILYAMSNVYVGYCGPNLHCLLAFGTCIGIIVWKHNVVIWN